ncbi:mannitol 2-dehydrogenase [Geosmithia morbida]|uniref:Mannitol 2-dehydrogenase n=1 Tax=Geosmithia morbida TaxID=1094350 RepID=A0A9P4YZP8_9HYPO|nr:mannitol 2-dehydrogenase [Geosmithia morbida]KAF4125502.1 mannitol 2-dehydrogenase [Geosmithia morbida]
MAAVKVNNDTLKEISHHAQSSNHVIETPTYDRSGIKESIVHIGVGGFHRAHLAVYVDELIGKHGVRDWGIGGIGLQPFDAAMRDALTPQDYLYTVLERSEAGSKARIIGSINSFLFAPDSPEAVLAKLAHPDTRIVSMTITESGYFYNENTHEMETHHPDIVADLASDLSAPRTTFGYLFAALSRRKAAGLRPFTVLSCDNMQKNGSITRHMLVTFARLRDPEVAAWIDKEGGFPNSMVDRITPRTSDADKASLAESFGIQDNWPVVTEPFMQWVVEDHFADGRPPFEKVGVQVVKDVSDVEKFECHKLRLLNASHTSISYAAYLGGFTYVHEVFANPLFHKYIYNMMHSEVKPLLPAIPGVDIDKYCDTLLSRFSNPAIMDQVGRLTLNGSGKLPQFIMPSVAEQIMAGTHNFRRLIFCVASWFRYLNGTDEKGNAYEIDDPMAEDLKARALAGGSSPYPLLDVKSLFGDDLRGDKVFVDEITKALESLYSEGAMATLAKYVD